MKKRKHICFSKRNGSCGVSPSPKPRVRDSPRDLGQTDAFSQFADKECEEFPMRATATPFDFSMKKGFLSDLVSGTFVSFGCGTDRGCAILEMNYLELGG